MPINKELMRQWTAAGYEPIMGSGWVVPPTPSHLRRVYHLTSSEYAINNIGLNRIKISRFSDSNDPFELMAPAFDDKQSRQIIRKFKEQYDRDMGLLCFTANWVSPVLWSHYGARHRGICLGFDVPRDKLLEVTYANARIRTEVGKLNKEQDINEVLRQLLICTKFRHWDYEKEWRMQVPLSKSIKEGSNYFWRFDRDIQLTEVILGPLCDLSLGAARRLVKSLHPSAVHFNRV